MSEKETNPTMTPMLRQYFELQEKVPEAILFFRMGDFYEVFGHSAQEIAPKLEIVLTAREKGDQTKIPFCGVPHHSAQSYYLKLLRLGYKVAIAEQIDDPALTKGLLRRDITRILTPGCIDELEGLDSKSNNFLCAIYELPKTKSIVLAAIDISTGEFRVGEVEEKSLADFVSYFAPAQILTRGFFAERTKLLLSRYLQGSRVLFDLLPEAPLRDDALQKKFLKDHFAVTAFSKLPCGQVEGGQELVAAVLQYLTQLKISTAVLKTIRPLKESDRIHLSENTIRDLELFETSRRRQREGSLLNCIDFTATAMGARLLKEWIGRPLNRQHEVEQRHDMVESLMEMQTEKFLTLRSDLKLISDVRRIAARVAIGKAQPREIALLRNSLVVLDTWKKNAVQKNRSLSEIKATSEKLSSLKELLEATIEENPNELGTGFGVLKSGVRKDYDQIADLARHGEIKVQQYEEVLRKQSGITSLKIKTHQSFGLLIEITKSNLAKVPSTFIRRQTMVNCERFSTTELADLDQKLSDAQQSAIRLEQEIYFELIQKISESVETLFRLSDLIAEFDCLATFAYLSKKHKFVRPNLTRDILDLKKSRHPVVESLVGSHAFTPNDFSFNANRKLLLITGPNMAGKSTAMRQVALCALLSQMGCFVPAEKATLPVFDQFFTRVGASDDLALGQSTFMVEMIEASEILRNATRSSLVIVDEIGRGTSSADGFALACAILEDLTRRVGCFGMFATHFHEIVPFAKSFPIVGFVQTEVIKKDEEVRFPHRLVEGFASRSYGIEVAKLAGLPVEVVKRAAEFLDQSQNVKDAPSVGASKHKISKIQRDLFGLAEKEQADRSIKGASASQENKAQNTESADRLRDVTILMEKINIHKTTPLQALNHLNTLKSLIFSPRQKSLFDAENLGANSPSENSEISV